MNRNPILLADMAARLGAELAARPWFWAGFALLLIAIAACSSFWFARQWPRALLAGLAALASALALCARP
jgi:hypothetical protein